MPISRCSSLAARQVAPKGVVAGQGDAELYRSVAPLSRFRLSIAQFDPDWGAADLVRATLAPFRQRP
ncbi:hypothetical protein [Nonomuraea sp. NPDC049400]|uniref:hypothetical protein n=1 Tax=Nonomuraea sp. NPDC049400 TaxID=3364352 RepID=UPI0037B7D56C